MILVFVCPLRLLRGDLDDVVAFVTDPNHAKGLYLAQVRALLYTSRDNILGTANQILLGDILNILITC